MKTICILMMLLLAGSVAGAPSKDLRTWRDQETAKAVVAELIAVEGDKITLRFENGRKYTLPATRFHRDDQAYVKQWVEDRALEKKWAEEKKKREEEEKMKPKTDDKKKEEEKKKKPAKPAEPFMVKREEAGKQFRTYTDISGKTLDGEVLAVKEGKATIRVSGNRKFALPVARLSEADRTFLTEWAEKNPSYGLNDLKFEIRKFRGSAARVKKDGNESKVTEVQWKGHVRNNLREDIDDVSIDYTVYERVSKKEGRTSHDKIEIKDFTDKIGKIGAGEDHEFESETIKEQEKSNKGDKKKKVPPTASRKVIEGVLFKVKVKERELIVYSDPPGFLDRLEEERRRWEEKQAREAAREAAREKKE